MLLVLDNRDSFVFNLDQAFRAMGVESKVLRSDRCTAAEVLALPLEGLVLSPGPGRPSEAGCLLDVVRRAPPDLPILGVCLGHQALAEAEGARIVQATEVFHGRNSWIRHEGAGLFEGLPNPIEACRYHSLVVEALPACYVADAWVTGPERLVMGFHHRELPRYGLQFHPESFRTPLGDRLLRSFRERCRRAG
ncbi:MAG: aminodeoxychorismate/anthranilate synthase component II [Planctomycetota bacterium]